MKGLSCKIQKKFMVNLKFLFMSKILCLKEKKESN